MKLRRDVSSRQPESNGLGQKSKATKWPSKKCHAIKISSFYVSSPRPVPNRHAVDAVN